MFFQCPPFQHRRSRIRWGFALAMPVCLLILSSCLPQVAAPVSQDLPPAPEATFTPLPTLSPAPSPTATGTPPPLGCTDTLGKVERRQVESKLLGKPLPVRVFLPPCYAIHSQYRYPVLFLLHGQSFTNDQWERLGAPATAGRLMSAGEIPPFLIVMPQEEYYLMEHSESKFGQTLADELVPWIDNEYTTCTQRECRAIGGISRGAAWAVRIGYVRWELFGAIGGHSLPPFRGDPNNLPRWLEKIPKNQRPKLWLDTGNQDTYLSATRQFEELLNKYGVVHEWRLQEGTHNEEYWGAHVEEYLRWYASTFPPAVPPPTGD